MDLGLNGALRLCVYRIGYTLGAPHQTESPFTPLSLVIDKWARNAVNSVPSRCNSQVNGATIVQSGKDWGFRQGICTTPGTSSTLKTDDVCRIPAKASEGSQLTTEPVRGFGGGGASPSLRGLSGPCPPWRKCLYGGRKS